MLLLLFLQPMILLLKKIVNRSRKVSPFHVSIGRIV